MSPTIHGRIDATGTYTPYERPQARGTVWCSGRSIPGPRATKPHTPPPGWKSLVADAEHLVATPQFKELAGVIEELLDSGLVLSESRLADVHRALGGHTFGSKSIKAATRTSTDLGQFTAIAAAYGVDRGGDRIRPGAFAKTLAAWRERGNPIPLHWAHKGDPQYIIGQVDP